MGNINKGKKLLKIGHALNPRDPVLLQSLALLEYKYSSANIARVLFRRASELDPRHQPVWIVSISTKMALKETIKFVIQRNQMNNQKKISFFFSLYHAILFMHKIAFVIS